MDRVALDSSSLAEVGYDERSSTLEVRFVTGRVYRFFGVPRATFDALVAAPSAGRYFNWHVRGVFPYARA